MATRKDVRVPGNNSRPAAEDDILKLLDKKKESVEDTNTLWNYLQNNELISMGDEKGLIRFYLQEKQISRMWEIAACRYSEIAHLMASNDKDLKDLNDLRDKTVEAPNDDVAKKKYAKAVGPHADPVVDAMLPQAVKSPVKFIVKTGEIKGGFGFPFKDNFEMTISSDKRNKYSVHIGGDKRNILLSVQRNPDPLPDAVKSPVPGTDDPKSCVMAFTFDKIIVYIRFAGPTMLVGKAFKANWAAESEDKILWGDLVLAKDNSN